MRSSLLTLASAGLLLTGAGVAPRTATHPLCSLAPFPDARASQVTYLLGRARPDTVLAGKGDVEPTSHGGHWGRGAPRPVYGQLVTTNGFGGADSVSLARAFQRRSSRMVLIVPWDYDSGCETTYWNGSARWIRLRDPGMFALKLRPQSRWANGIPTLDAFVADLEPYPHGLFFQRGYRGTDALKTKPSLTAAEYFELYRALPERETFRTDPAAARRLLDAWERGNPHLAKKYPATKILEDARSNLKYPD